MKHIVMIALIMLLASCSASRVLVKDCHDAGPGISNCEKVKDL